MKIKPTRSSAPYFQLEINREQLRGLTVIDISGAAYRVHRYLAPINAPD